MWQPVLMIDGYILSVLGLSMLIPAALDFYDAGIMWSPFFTSALITVFIGVALFLSNRVRITGISLRQGYLITGICWISVGFFAAIPFLLTGAVQNWVSAVFECVSGITGTGSTVLTDVEAQSRSVLLWRSMLNGLGGIGIIIFAVAMLPFLGIGGMQIFQRENSDAGDKFMPKFIDIAKWLIACYLGLVILCALLLYWCGMSKFDALNHALTAVATGGFSTKNNSVAFFDSAAIETVLSAFMMLGALPMTFYVMLIRGREIDDFRLGQIKQFLKTVFILILLITLWISWQNNVEFLKALRWSSFNIISVITTTGYGSVEFLDWGIWTGLFFTLLSLHGGCIGSTTGSIKVMRWQVFSSYSHKLFVSAIDQNRVVPVKVGDVPVDDKVVTSVLVYILLFLITTAVSAVILNFMGYDFMVSLSASVASITNTGPGIVKEIGAMGNYAFFSSGAKWVLIAVMMLGRLEIITLLVVFTKAFWRH